MGCYHLLFSFMCPISLICWQTLSVCFSLVALSALQKEKKKRGAYGDPSQTCSSTFKGLSCSRLSSALGIWGPCIVLCGAIPPHFASWVSSFPRTDGPMD